MSHICVNEICNDIKFYDNMREYNDEFGSKANFFSLKLGLMSEFEHEIRERKFPNHNPVCAFPTLNTNP